MRIPEEWRVRASADALRGSIFPMSQSPEPRCPRCRRRIAAWKLDHCVYCGAPFPPELKQDAPPPEALRWVERPDLPADAMRQLEMMKVVPMDREKRSHSLLLTASLISLPLFAGIFYMLYRLLARYSPPIAMLVLIGGAGFILYLAVAALRSRSR